MNEEDISPEQFQAIQLGWIAALSQPALYTLMQDLARSATVQGRDRGDLTPMATKDGLMLPRNTKISSDVDASGHPGVTICYSCDPDDPVAHPYHCLTIENPFAPS